jgi:2,3-bisphosphoglycerate-independent phosphoglycerate mutase
LNQNNRNELNPVLMIFIDGVGIGKEDYQFNPFFKYGFKTFTEIFGEIPSLNKQFLSSKGSFLFPTDACLGVAGLPQSGTGQTSIFCGMNAAKYIGKHFGPFPYSTLIPIIKKENILGTYLKKKHKVSFANAYPKQFFDYVKSGRGRLSVTTLSCKLSGIRLKTTTDLKRGKALTAEITNDRWIKKLEYSLPQISPKLAAKRLLRIAANNKFTLYEFYLTDHLGHGRDAGEFDNVICTLDEFLLKVITEMEKKNMTLIICSDHGNFEDISVKTHTLNPALTITSGRHAEKLSERIKDLTQIKPAILEICE